MSKPVGPNMATAGTLGPPGVQTAQKQHAGLLELDAQPSVASIRLPEGAAPKVSAPVQVRRAHIRTPARHRAPYQGPGRILIPGDGAAGDQGLRTGLRGGNSGYATPAACPVSALPGAMVSGAHAVL
jgi:hypothetical protein